MVITSKNPISLCNIHLIVSLSLSLIIYCLVLYKIQVKKVDPAKGTRLRFFKFTHPLNNFLYICFDLCVIYSIGGS